MKTHAALLSLLATLAAPLVVRAQPNIWDTAKDRRSARAHYALLKVERTLLRVDMAFDPFMQRHATRESLAMLELAGGEELPDSRVHYLLGDLLIDSSIGREVEARKVLERALALDPDSPLAGRGWFNLAIACAKLGDPGRERAAYTHALKVVWEPRFRANILVNRGESAMVQGDLKAAVSDYRAAIKLASGPDHQALAHYGLGIALERSGDLPAALDAMRVAEAITLPPYGSALDLPGVFFVPEFDRHYYRALGAMANARQETDPAKQTAELERAVSEWTAYLSEAEPAKHRWVESAKLHRASIEKKLSKRGVTPKKKAERDPLLDF